MGHAIVGRQMVWIDGGGAALKGLDPLAITFKGVGAVRPEPSVESPVAERRRGLRVGLHHAVPGIDGQIGELGGRVCVAIAVYRGQWMHSPVSAAPVRPIHGWIVVATRVGLSA